MGWVGARDGLVQGWAGAGVGIGMGLVVGIPSIENKNKIQNIKVPLFENYQMSNSALLEDIDTKCPFHGF